eukprot:894661-Amphidinium_carterae.1
MNIGGTGTANLSFYTTPWVAMNKSKNHHSRMWAKPSNGNVNFKYHVRSVQSESGHVNTLLKFYSG